MSGAPADEQPAEMASAGGAAAGTATGPAVDAGAGPAAPQRPADGAAPHVLIVPSWYPSAEAPLAGSFFREQAQALAAAGMRVGVLVPRLSGGRLTGLWQCLRPTDATALTAPTGWDASTPTVPTPVAPASQPTPALQHAPAVDSPPGEALAPECPTLEVPLARTVPLGRRVNVRLSWPGLRRAFDAYCQRYGRPTVIQAHSLIPGGYVAAALSRYAGIPWVLTEHRTLAAIPTRTPLGRTSEHLLAASASACVAVSRGQAEILAPRLGISADQWQIIPNLLPAACVLPAESTAGRGRDAGTVGGAVDTPTHAGSAAVHSPVTDTADRPVIIGHASIIDEVKRLDLIVEAFAAVAADDARLHLRIAGPLDSAAGRALRAQVDSHPLRERICLRGPVAREEMPAFMAGCDLFVLASDSETFGIVLIEALAAGTPVLSTDAVGPRDILAAGAGDGRLVPCGDLPALTRALREMTATESLRQLNSPEARQARARRYRQRYGAQAFVSRYRRLYDSVATPPSGT